MAPDPATLGTATAGDTQVTLAVTTDTQSDTIYARYRIVGSGNAWSAQSDTFKRTGDGDIIITGLTNGIQYEFIIYVNNGGCQSDWSTPAMAAPFSGICSIGADPHWARWIFASVSKHFDTYKGDLLMFIEGQHRGIHPPKDFIELRMDGPYLTEINKNVFKVYIEVNVMVQSRMDDTNYHRIHDDVGKVSSMFTSIDLYKYGTSSFDTGEHFGCLSLLQSTQNRKRIQVNHFGQIEPELQLMQASVEGHYEITLTI